ncbi:hypothetical protein TNCV_2721821 [Trichonephila clavipes]|nr:hypothetical protein TNCV_2721821 [Trichonephila clavipes]
MFAKFFLRHGFTLNSRRTATVLVGLVEGEERWEAPDPPQDVIPQNLGGTRAKSYCMVLKAKANDRRKNLAPCHDEFRGTLSDVNVDKVA